MLNCTWDDVEAETALRRLNLPVEEQRKLHHYYLKLREEYRKAVQAAVSPDAESKSQAE